MRSELLTLHRYGEGFRLKDSGSMNGDQDNLTNEFNKLIGS